MTSIIEDFYFGKIVPGETPVSRSSRQMVAVGKAADAEEFLLGRLDEECRAELKKLIDAQTDISMDSTLENYVRGFRHGAKFMLDILRGEDEGA